ncbi:hypothetical protein SAMN04490239_0546 [Rhodococcus koreensis]|uniref:Uncharacterized protein n=1 Tax=Rhodococcus koreensis TaxID=99653 RepID=A0A1H4IGC1_9NOCA|nr:hypothetical protein SAMN04490239_0546 [Rhodococcus koreensis]
MFVVGCTAGGVPYGCFEDEPDGDAFGAVAADPFGWPGTRPRPDNRSGPARSTRPRSSMCAIDAGTHFSSVAVPNVHAENGFGCGGVSLGPASRSKPVANGYTGRSAHRVSS